MTGSSKYALSVETQKELRLWLLEVQLYGSHEAAELAARARRTLDLLGAFDDR